VGSPPCRHFKIVTDKSSSSQAAAAETYDSRVAFLQVGISTRLNLRTPVDPIGTHWNRFEPY
jgi:hypothetical protein